MERADFGVLYGQKTTEDALLIYSSYEDSKSSPSVGDFIVLAPRDESGHKFLARVEAEVYDEDPLFRSQDKTLVAVHYARIAERELSERDKQKMFSYTYKVRMLGTFVDRGTSLSFTTAVRKLPVVSYHARHLQPTEVAHMLNLGNETGVPLGHLCIGEEIHQDKGPILFDTNRLKSKRTMIFAQSGFGKTNLMKVLLYHIVGDNSFGKLVFDLNGEYFSKTAAQTVGLGDVDEKQIRDNLIVYSDRKITKTKGFTYAGKVQVNTHKHMTVGDILSFSTGFSEVMKSFLLYLDDKQVEGFVKKIDSYCEAPQTLYKDFPDFFGNKAEGDDKRQDKSARGTKGRKFGIGLVAITQRPSAISEEIRSQAENFFTFYMGNSDDVKALIKSNINYDGVVASFIQRETIPGNLYFVTSSHPFVIPVRVVEFDKLVADKQYK